jgi:thioredoxin reductase (NADPH)
MPFAFLLLFLGARPFTEWLAGVIAPDRDGFILTGADVGGGYLPDTSVPGVSRNEGAAVGGGGAA